LKLSESVEVVSELRGEKSVVKDKMKTEVIDIRNVLQGENGHGERSTSRFEFSMFLAFAFLAVS